MVSKKKAAAYTALVVVVIVFAVIPVATAYLSLHPPRCKPIRNPAARGLAYENVSIKADGIELSGWLIEPAAPEKREIFVVMHGYTSCKASEEVLAVSSELARRGYRVLAFDFRAHGESGGSATSIGPLEAGVNTRSAVDWVAKRYPGRPVVLLGFSMGAVAAIMEGAGDPRVAAIVADSPYPLLSEVVPRWLGSKMGVPDWYSRLIGAWGSLLAGERLDYGPYKLGTVPKTPHSSGWHRRPPSKTGGG